MRNGSFAPQRLRRAVHLALPLGLIGFAGSWFVCDYYRLGFAGAEQSARGILTFTIPFAGAFVGLVLSSRPVARRRWATVLALVLCTLLAGGVVGSAVGGTLWRRPMSVGAFWSGVETSLAFLPFIAVITLLARTAGRARPGSIVDDADRRAPWTVIASGVAIGRLVTAGAPYGSFNSIDASDQLHSVCSALALLACVALTVIAIFDLVGLRQAQRAWSALLNMTERDPNEGLPCDNTEDMGLGDMEHEELFGGPAYRTAPRPLYVVRGSPGDAVSTLRRSVVATWTCTIVSYCITAITLSDRF